MKIGGLCVSGGISNPHHPVMLSKADRRSKGDRSRNIYEMFPSSNPCQGIFSGLEIDSLGRAENSGGKNSLSVTNEREHDSTVNRVETRS
jgi:hypothetical protein